MGALARVHRRAAIALARRVFGWIELKFIGGELSMASLATDQALALAMARHPRLGAASPASALGEDTISTIFGFVQEAHRKLMTSKRLVSICVRTGDLVDRIEFHYSDGSLRAHGGRGGVWRRPLMLEPGEFITVVSGRKGDSLDSIEFSTSRGVTRGFSGILNGGQDEFVESFAGMGLEISDLFTTRAPGGWLKSASARTQPTLWQSSMARLLLAHPTPPPAPPLGPFIHRVGALAAGNDLEVRICTFAQAIERAAALPNCAGFCFHSAAPTFAGSAEVFFKDRRDGNNDWRWQTYLRSDWMGADPLPSNWPGNDFDDPGYDQFDWGYDEEDDDDDDDDFDEDEDEDQGEYDHWDDHYNVGSNDEEDDEDEDEEEDEND